MEYSFDLTSWNYFCVLKPLSLRKRDLIYDGTQYASECLKMMDILDIDSLCVEFTDAKDLIDKELVYQSKPTVYKVKECFWKAGN